MITAEMITPIGHLFKPHGYKGELNADIIFDSSIFDDPETPFFVYIDNILVPFFVETIGGGQNNTSFIKFKNIDSDTEALVVAKRELYALKSFILENFEITEEELEFDSGALMGFEVIDLKSEEVIGIVEDIEEGVEYEYLVVRKLSDDSTVHIPFLDEFVKEILELEGSGAGKILVELPEGFLEI